MSPTSDLSCRLPREMGPIRIGPAEQFARFEKEEVDQSIPDRFEKIASAHADRIAVVTRAERLTYGELNRLSNHMARAVVAECGEGNDAVALLLGRGAASLAAILGVLKAGKFFVPLDPAQPAARNRSMLEDSGAGLVLVNDENMVAAATIAGGPWRLVRIENIPHSALGENLSLRIRPDDAAYILYTSGSTGTPKGVVQNHRNVLHCALRLTNALHISPSDRLTFLLSITHSAALVDFFGALLNGAALFPFDMREEGLTRLARWLGDNKLTIAHMVPTLFRHFALSLTQEISLPDLRIMKLSGEQVTLREVELCRRIFSERTLLLNAYGATEINAVRHFFMGQTTPVEGSVVPAGFETEDTEISILDDEGREVGANCMGEIVIRSPYLSPGYWQKPELTAEAFLTDPRNPNGTLYRTGDIGYVNPDGCLFHLGRKDQQVKLRGHRIELAEIELAILRDRVIKECVVVARDGVAGKKQLVAYVVPDQEQILDTHSIRDSLKALLPSYMIPAAIVQLNRVPLTATGKTDRLSLPAPDAGSILRSTMPVAPRDGIEEHLVAIWEEVLETRPIGVEDNFFDVGGDSLLAMQLLLEVEKRFGIDIPSSMLLETATIAGLAKRLRNWNVAAEFPCLVPIQSGGERPPFFCFHELSGDVLHYRQLVSHMSPDQPAYGLTSRGLDTKDLDRIEDMTERYVEAIRSVQPRGPYFVGGYSAGGVWALEAANQLLAAGERVALLAMLDTIFPIDTRPPSKIDVASSILKYEVALLRSLRLRQAPPFIVTKLWRACRRTAGLVSRAAGVEEDRQGSQAAGSDAPVPRYPWADQRVAAAYLRYKPRRCRTPITFFWTAGDTSFPALQKRDPRTGWRDIARGGMEIHEVPGDHTTVLGEPHVKVLADKLSHCLLKAQARSQ